MNIFFNKGKIRELVPYIVLGAITVGATSGGIRYYLDDNFQDSIKEIDDTDISLNDLEVSENGNIYYLFDVGEHKVKISRNDAWYRKIDSVDGYEIESVELMGWKDNSQVTYVNKVPVKVKMTDVIDGKRKFEEFGIVVEKKTISK